MKTYIIIPNYIATEELKELATNTIKSFRESSKDIVIISVDDYSPLDCTFLKELSDIYIKNKKNLGFAKSCNKGFKRAFKEGENYIVCANNDIEVYKGWQEAMIKPFNEYDNVAVTGIKHTREKELDGKKLCDIIGTKITEGGLIGECMQDGGLWLSKSSILKKIGIFDEQFIRGGYEDVDLFLRMRDTFGMKIIMSEEVAYWHKEGSTRWNNECGEGFRNESKAIENDNLEKFIKKWGYDPRKKQIWYSNQLKN